MANELWVDNDSVLTLTGAMDEVTDAYLNSATVTGRVYDSTTSGGVPVPGSTPLAAAVTLSYVAASDGDYRGVVEADAFSPALTAGTRYWIKFTLVSGGVDAVWWVESFARYRRAR